MYRNIFIIGVGRSGTSLLQSMLHAHPDIEFLPETQFLRKYVLKNIHKKFRDGTEKQDFLEKLQRDEKLDRIKVDMEALVQESSSYREAYQKLLEKAAPGNPTYIGDKDPRFLDFIPQLHQVSPDAKVIHIIRDPRDVVLSRTKADWSKHWPFFMHACMYSAQLERGRKLGKKFFGDNYIELYYEDLISRPEEVLRKVSKFLGIPYSPSMLDFGDSAKTLVDEKEMQWKKETLGPLLKENAQKWRKGLDQDQIHLVQRICKDAFKHHPYLKIHIDPPLPLKLKGWAYAAFSAFFGFLYPVRVKFLK